MLRSRTAPLLVIRGPCRTSSSRLLAFKAPSEFDFHKEVLKTACEKLDKADALRLMKSWHELELLFIKKDAEVKVKEAEVKQMQAEQADKALVEEDLALYKTMYMQARGQLSMRGLIEFAEDCFVQSSEWGKSRAERWEIILQRKPELMLSLRGISPEWKRLPPAVAGERIAELYEQLVAYDHSAPFKESMDAGEQH